MTYLKLLLVTALFLTLNGCASPTGNFLGHAVIPGYSTVKITQDKQAVMQQAVYEEAMVDQLTYMEAGHTGIQPRGVDIISFVDALMAGDWVLAVAILWDGTKAMLIIEGVSQIQDAHDSNDPPKEKKNKGRIPADGNNQKNDLYIEGNNNNFDAEDESIDDIYVKGDNNSVNINETEAANEAPITP